MRLEHLLREGKPGQSFISKSEPNVSFTAVQNPLCNRIEWLRFKKYSDGDTTMTTAEFTARDFRKDDYELL